MDGLPPQIETIADPSPENGSGSLGPIPALLARLRGLRNRQLAWKTLINALWLVSERVFRMGMGLAVGVWIARYLGPDRFGLLNYGIALTSLLAALCTLGLDSIVIRNIVRRPDAEGEILATASFLRLLGSLLVIACATSAAAVVGPKDSGVVSLVLVLSAVNLFRPFDSIDLWFQAHIRAGLPVLVRNVAFLSSTACKVALVLTGAGVVAFAGAELFGALITAAGLVYVYHKAGGSFLRWRARLGVARDMLHDSWPLLLSGLAVMVYMRIDQLMLQRMAGMEAVGIYSAAIRVSEVWYFIPVALVSSLYPSIVRLKELNETLYYRRLQQLFTLMAIIAAAIAIPMTFLSHHLIHLLYGSRFTGAAPILTIHIWTALFVFWGVAQEPWYISEGLTRMALVRTVLGAMINITLNLWSIPRFGAIGAAIATVLSQCIVAFLWNAFHPATRRIFAMQLRAICFFGGLKS